MDVELVEDPAEMAGVTVDGVVEAIRFVGTAVSGRSGATARANAPVRATGAAAAGVDHEVGGKQLSIGWVTGWSIEWS